MSDEKALVPIEQKTVNFQGDDITAVLVETEEGEQVFVPLRPICDYLDVNWDGQRRRILRDPVLSDEMRSVVVTTTDIEPGSTRPRTSEMLCLPLEFINGWLFGINASRVKEEIRENLIRYQRECYKVLARAFLERAETAISPAMNTLIQIRNNALAVAALAEQQMEHEMRISTAESRLDKASDAFIDLRRRVKEVERRTAPESLVDREQAAEISLKVKALGEMLTEGNPDVNWYQRVFTELYRRFGVSSYKDIPKGKYKAVMEFLDDWHRRATQ